MKLDVPLDLRWFDLDAYNHVNNVQMLRLLEEARVRAFWTREDDTQVDSGMAVVDAGAGSDTHTLIASQRVEYHLPLTYRQRPVIIRLWVGKLGGASLEVYYEVLDSAEEGAVRYASAHTTIVVTSAETGTPTRIGDAQREAWGRYLDEPLTFRSS